MLTNQNGNGRNPRWWQSIWGRSHRASADLSAYSRLALQLHYDLPRDSGLRSVLLLTPKTSRLGPHGGLELAFSLGQELDRSVLLIDACPARPEISGMLGCAQLPGWSDLLRDPNLELQSVTLPTSSETVQFLPAGSHRHGAAAPEDVQARLKIAQEHYDFLVLFGGSILEDFTDMALPSNTGCVLLLVTENETLTGDLEASQEALASCNARNVHLVLASPLRGKPGLLPDSHAKARTQLAAITDLVSEKGS